MSAIAGMYSRSGAPIHREVLAGMSRALRQMGPDGERFALSEPVGMVYRPFHTDRESRRTDQPVVTGDGYVLGFDGRLDNAREVRAELGADARATSVQLVLEAYRRWGVEAFARLVGDFALALWDPREHRLLLCSDSMGRRPLYYHCGPEHVFWASQSRPLLEAAGLPVELDEEYVADFLANRLPSGSPFRGIGVVPGGHVLVADRAGAVLKRYWSIDPARRVTYRSDHEYEEHFAGLFREAVACRLQTEDPVFCELSGGVDSSTIVCVADELMRGGRVSAPGMTTVSYVFDQAASSDEREYIGMVEAQLGTQGIYISESQAPLLRPLPESFAPDIPCNKLSFIARQDHLTREMQRLGSRVVLSGIGGDQMFWAQYRPGLPLADHLVQGQLVELVRSCAEWSRVAGLPFLKTFWEGACQPLLPRSWQARLQSDAPLGEWFHPGFVKRMNFRERILPMSDDLGFRLPSSSSQYGLLRRTMRIFALERCSSEGYVEARYPYLDRRLVEFVMAIPLEQKIRPGESRSLVRRALKGIVPEGVLQRRTKSGPTEALHRALIREWSWLSAILSEPRVAAHGFVDREAFRTVLNRARHGLATNQSQLLKTISLELWLRTLEERPQNEDTVPPEQRRSQHPGGSHVREACLREA